MRTGAPDWRGFTRAGFDPEALWERVDGDPQLLREVTAVFEKEFPGMMAAIDAAIGEQDGPVLEKAGHKAKGALLQFSAHAAAATALKLEEMGRKSSMAGAQALLEKLKHESEQLRKSLHRMIDTMAQ